MQYEDFQLLATQVQEVKAEGTKWITFKVQVPRSPAGEITSGVDSKYDSREIRQLVGKWDSRQPDWLYAIQIGHVLAGILFPEPVRELLVRSRDIIKGQGKRLRLRLMLEGALHNLPWEYVLLNQGGGEATPTDFLGLSPDISIVRHQAATIPAWDVTAELPALLVAALASPEGPPELNLAKEREALTAALKDRDDIKVVWKDAATKDTLLADVPQAHLFHFAGHGVLKLEMADQPGTFAGAGSIVLDDGFGDPDELPASQLALQLRKVGVRVAVLGACESGRRDDVNVWSSVAAALLKADLGAVVAMQYKVRDDSAIAFAGELYRGLVAGLTIDDAVTNGRIKVAQNDVAGWGTPVLYMRAPDGVVFPEYAASPELEPAREQLRVEAAQQVETVRGSLIGIKAKTVTAGELIAIQKLGTVEKGATVVGVDVENVGGGSITSRQEAETVEGDMTGVRLDNLG
jgi:hypothetical protein